LKIDVNNIKEFDVFHKQVFNNNNSNNISFSEILKNSLSKVNQLQLESQKLNEQLAIGNVENVHQVIIAAQKAELALQFTLQIRNKILDAYNEIMRISI